MELILIIILLIIILIIGIISLTKNINESNITERLGKLENNMIKDLGEFKSDINRNINEDFVALTERIDTRLRLINDKVSERLDENFEKTNKTFTSVLERLSKIDAAQQKIDNLSADIISLQSILTDKKSRGIFGEVNLNHILVSVFGENNNNVYQLQYKYPTGVIVDCVLFAPNPLGTISIDSKFPLESYQLMVDKNNDMYTRDEATKQFKIDVKKHIDAISDKYIIEGITSNQAIMFLPAEAIFAEINAYHQDILNYAYKKRVWLASPTTLISTLTVIEMLLKNMERDKYSAIIHEELSKLGSEFARYKDRWDKLSRSIQAVNKDVENINVTTEKITKRFESINKVELNDNLIEMQELD